MRKLSAATVLRADLGQRIVDLANEFVVQTGEVLETARQELGLMEYERFVVEQLPFGIETARRYRAVYLAVTNLPDAPLPAAHRALYAVGHGDMPECVQEPCRSAQETAGELLRHDASELSGRLRVSLEAWLAGH